jgi:hypothetical protein
MANASCVAIEVNATHCKIHTEPITHTTQTYAFDPDPNPSAQCYVKLQIPYATDWILTNVNVSMALQRRWMLIAAL